MRQLAVIALLLALAACREDTKPVAAPTPTPASSASPTSPTSPSPTGPPVVSQHGLRARLTHDPKALRELIGKPRPRGVALCGVDVLGHGPGELYAWVACADFRTGPDAQSLSGTSEPVVVRPDGFTFPRQAYLEQDIDRLFPPDVAHAIRYGDVHPTPSLAQLLVMARGRRGGPACSGAQLSAEQPTPGGPAAGTFYVPVLITNNGPDCSLLADDLVLWVGSPARSRAALDVTGSGPVVLMPTGHTLSTYAFWPSQPCRGAGSGPPVRLALSDDTAVRPQVSVAGPGVPPDHGLCPNAGFTTSAGRRAAPSR